jgi:hypothetical protein
MNCCLNILLALSSILTLTACGSNTNSNRSSLSDAKLASAGVASNSNFNLGNRYTISSTLEILKPVKLSSMTNDAQKVEVLSENSLTIKVRITVDPTKDQVSQLTPNLNWKDEYSKNSDLQKYISPGITTNWDEQMKADLLAALAKANIFPDKLSDVDLVRKVSQWIFASSEFQFQDHFVSYDVEFVNGKAQVIPDLQDHFNSEKIKNKFPSDKEALEQGIFGKAMFASRKFGNCTYSATLQATVLKALGIPTRLVLMVPAIDWNDQSQWNMIRDNIHQHSIQKTVLQGLALQGVGGWGSHTFNEVYVGNQWVRLNYTKLGQIPADPQFFGLMLQVNEMSDWSEANLGRTWGVHAQSHNLTTLSSNNPYKSFEIKDASAVLNADNNPPLATPELKVLALLKSYNSDATDIPDVIRNNLTADPSFAITIKSDLPSFQYNDLAVFRRNVSRRFVLRANGVPDVPVRESGSWFEPEFTALKFSPQSMDQLIEEVEYSLVPESNSGEYYWAVSPSLKLMKPKLTSSPDIPVTIPSLPASGNFFNKTATVTNAKLSSLSEMKCPVGKTCIILVLAEKFDLANLNPVTDFYSKAPTSFSIKKNGNVEIPLSFYGITTTNQGQNGGFVFTVDEHLMESGVDYEIQYKSNPTVGQFSWVLPSGLTVKR